jgi:hypothetical protein
MTEQELKWEFGKKWVLKQKPKVDQAFLMTILRAFAFREFQGNQNVKLQLSKICSAIEHDYQTFVESEGGLLNLIGGSQ